MARVTIAIPTPLRPLVDGRAELEVQADTVSAALEALGDWSASLRAQLYGDDGELRNFVNVYLGDRELRQLSEDEKELHDGARLTIVPSIAGGAPSRSTARPSGDAADAGSSPAAFQAAAPGTSSPAENLTREEMRRYARHLSMPEVGVEGQQRLKAASVLLVGVGGLGSPAALYLAAAGVGRMGLVDHDAVEFTNLQRQILHDTPSVGRSKLESARARIAGLNPEVEIETHAARLTSENALEILSGYDLVVDGSDNFPTRYLVNDACVLLGLPLVYGAIFRFEGQASVFGLDGGPCYRCLFREPPPPELAPNCAQAGVLGVLPGIVGTIQATEAVKLIIGCGEPLSGRLLLIDALRMDFRELRVERDPECPVCGEHPTVTELIDYEQFCGAPAASGDGRGAVRDAGAAGEPVAGGAAGGAAATGEATPGEAAAAATANTRVPEMSVLDLRDALAEDEEVILLDVREPYEWEICNLAGHGARLIPLGELPERLEELERDARLVVYCRTGARSRSAVEFLHGAGFTDAVNLAGGIRDWAGQVDPEMPIY